MKNPLSDIYSEKVLLQEAAKSNVVVKPGQQEIAKGGKVPVAKSGGDEKVKKNVPKAKESKEYSDGGKAKKVSLKEEAGFEGAFEKLFKATLNEEFGGSMNPFEPEVPTTNDDMVDELGETEDEVSDLTSDLKGIIDSLQTILDKIGNEEEGSEDESYEDESSEEAKDEIENEIREESKDEEEDEHEEKVEEAVDAEEKGHALHNLKAGTDLQKPGSREVKGAVPVSKGKANGGNIDSDDKLKPAKSFDKSLQSPKSKPEVSCTIKAGDFFKK
jgi:hypothetical protein